MTAVLQVGDWSVTTDDLVPLLVSYDLIPQILYERMLDQATESITCSAEEINDSIQRFQQRWNLTSEAGLNLWRSSYGLSQEQLEHLVTRKLKREKLKQMMWERSLESYFLKRKDELDAVIYSLIRVRDKEMAQELYFRLQEGEQSFVDLARMYSAGIESNTGGFLGPVEMGELPPNLIECLRASQPGEIQFPITIGEWQVIVRLEKLIPAQLDDDMRQRLLQEKFENWFQQQLERLQHREKIWLGLSTAID